MPVQGLNELAVPGTPVTEVDAVALADRIEREGIHTVEVGFADTVGALRGKQIPARHFLAQAWEGVPFCKAVLAWDIQCEVFPGVALASFDNGYPDLVARPDLATFRPVPWRPGTAIVLADLYEEHGGPIDVAPREVLRRVVARVTGLGYRPKVGAELEFYLIGEDGLPVYDGIQCYSLHKSHEIDHVIEDIRLGLEGIGIGVEAAGTEYGPAQVEVNLAYDDALTVADSVLLFKKAVKDIARARGLTATFMAKPWEDQCGSSFHVHQSLWSIDGAENLFADDKALAHGYLAGLLASARELTALAAPNVNSYKRFQDESFAPTRVGWGHDNRTVFARSLLGTGAHSRLENRLGSADANPYLVIAANLAAGLAGVTGRLDLPSGVEGNGYETSGEPLPSTLDDALDQLERSALAKEAFGAAFVELFAAIGRHDADANRAVVTEWERRRYLEMA